jgi:hypothetical protein
MVACAVLHGSTVAETLPVLAMLAALAKMRRAAQEAGLPDFGPVDSGQVADLISVIRARVHPAAAPGVAYQPKHRDRAA